MDSIGVAYRTLHYDEQFHQRKAVRSSIRWDHKDISLWMRQLLRSRDSPFRTQPSMQVQQQGGRLERFVAVAGNLMMGNANLVQTVTTGMNVPVVAELTGPCNILKRVGVRAATLTRRGEMPVRVSRMVPSLRDHQNREAEALLYEGFSKGFLLPCSSTPPVGSC